MNQTEKNIEISRKFDYSNAIPEIQLISFLVQCCDYYYKQFIKICEEDEMKNEKLKYEYKTFEYQKTYSTKCEITIREKESSFSNLSCKSYESFQELVNAGRLNNVNSIVIVLDLSFKRGKNTALKNYENIFKISFKPYDIVFIRKSNYAEPNMDQIENDINQILNKFKFQNTIFCTK